MKSIFKKFMAAAIVILIIPTTVTAQEQKKPEVAAQGAILMDAVTGRVLWEKNAETPLAMASTTKIMTAVLAIESGDLDALVTVSKRAAAAPRVKMYLSAGEKISLEGLVYALMLQSSNDAAVAIAEHIGGSVEDFCAEMTAKAHSLGAVNTVFETPNGLDAENHQSTAYDMALITRYALNNPTFVDIINTKSFYVSSSTSSYNINNKNRLLNEYEGAMGVKTGYTGKAGHCFVGAARRGDLQLISVVFASGWGSVGKEQKWIDTKRILSFGFDNFENEEVVNRGDFAGRLEITRSRTPDVGLYYGRSVVMPINRNAQEEVTLVPFFPASLQAPVSANQLVGSGRVYVNGDFFAEVPIFTDQGADRHDLKTSLEKVLIEFLRLGTNEKLKIYLPDLQ